MTACWRLSKKHERNVYSTTEKSQQEFEIQYAIHSRTNRRHPVSGKNYHFLFDPPASTDIQTRTTGNNDKKRSIIQGKNFGRTKKLVQFLRRMSKQLVTERYRDQPWTLQARLSIYEGFHNVWPRAFRKKVFETEDTSGKLSDFSHMLRYFATKTQKRRAQLFVRSSVKGVVETVLDVPIQTVVIKKINFNQLQKEKHLCCYKHRTWQLGIKVRDILPSNWQTPLTRRKTLVETSLNTQVAVFRDKNWKRPTQLSIRSSGEWVAQSVPIEGIRIVVIKKKQF